MSSDSNFSKSVLKLTGLIVALLLVPFIAMQFTAEVNWTLLDFVFAGALIFGTGFAYMVVTRNAEELAYRIAVGFFLFTGLILIWINLAVGIIGSEDNMINLLYYIVLATGVIGAIVSRFQIQGMIVSMFSCAIAVGIITIIYFLTGMKLAPESSLIEVLAMNGFFAFLFAVSGLLFINAKGDVKAEAED